MILIYRFYVWENQNLEKDKKISLWRWINGRKCFIFEFVGGWRVEVFNEWTKTPWLMVVCYPYKGLAPYLVNRLLSSGLGLWLVLSNWHSMVKTVVPMGRGSCWWVIAGISTNASWPKWRLVGEYIKCWKFDFR